MANELLQSHCRLLPTFRAAENLRSRQFRSTMRTRPYNCCDEMKRLILSVVLSSILATPAVAGPLEDASAAKMRLLRPLADQGNAKAQYELGNQYNEGWGAQNDAEVAKWWRKAAEQGYVQAQVALAELYSAGWDGVSGLYQVPQDYTEAVWWYRLAANQGSLLAQNNLGILFENGRGVPQDYVQAYMWFNLAAAKSKNPDSLEINNRDRVAAKMTPAQIAEAQKLARDWKPK